MNAAKSTVLTQTRYGTAHPEWVENTLWEEAIREEWTGYALCQHLGIRHSRPLPPRFHAFVLSRYDARAVTGAGSASAAPARRCRRARRPHRRRARGRLTIPTSASTMMWSSSIRADASSSISIPRTCFHRPTFTAQRSLGRDIILIGSLGYRDLRRIGETQVLKLDTRTLRIEPVATTGAAPGWISDHTRRDARRDGHSRVRRQRGYGGWLSGRIPVSSNSISRQ